MALRDILDTPPKKSPEYVKSPALIYWNDKEIGYVQAFWEKMGFVPNGHTYQWNGDVVESTVAEMEKEIGP